MRARRVMAFGVVVAFHVTAAGARARVPAIRVEPAAIDFSILTIGDVASESLTVTNDGDQDLSITAVELPDDVTIPGIAGLPFRLAPGGRARFAVVFAPLEAVPPSGPLRVQCDDPARPQVDIPLAADVQSLAVRTRALVATPAPLGEAATIQSIQVDSLARFESMRLHYRSRGDGTFGQQDMFRFDVTWVGFVPGSRVRESGVEYFVEARNDTVVRFDPPAGAGAPYSFDVAAPSSFTVTAERTTRSGFAAGTDIPVRIELPSGSDFDRGFLYFRLGGKARFDSLPLAIGVRPEALVGMIPGSFATHRGIEYRVALRTITSPALFYPTMGAPAASDTIRVSITNLVEPARHPGGRYRIVSVPVSYGQRSGHTLETLLSDQPEFGPYDPFVWRAFRYFNGANVELTRGDSLFLPDPGRGFWLICRSEHALDTAPVEGQSPSRPRDTRGRRIFLQPGWNQFGTPWGFPVAWSDVALEDTTAIRDLTAFDSQAGARGDYALESPVVLQPFEGYFIRNTSNRQLRMWVPWVEAGERVATAMRHADAVANARRRAPASLAQWSLLLTGRTSEAEDAANRFGVDPAASDGDDALDRGEPPPPPGNAWVRVAFGELRSDVRAAGLPVQAWNVEITTHAPGREVELAIAPDGAVLPADLAVTLLDRETQATVNLVTPGAGAFGVHRVLAYGPERVYRATLIAGAASEVARAVAERAILPAALGLDQNAPNPFNATTRLRFGLPRPARVTLEILNMRGELVAALLHDEPRAAGYHAIFWRGSDRTGRPVASGVYLARLRAGGASLTRRLVLLK